MKKGLTWRDGRSDLWNTTGRSAGRGGHEDNDVTDKEESISIEEVVEAIGKLKSRKGPRYMWKKMQKC